MEGVWEGEDWPNDDDDLITSSSGIKIWLTDEGLVGPEWENQIILKEWCIMLKINKDKWYKKTQHLYPQFHWGSLCHQNECQTITSLWHRCYYQTGPFFIWQTVSILTLTSTWHKVRKKTKELSPELLSSLNVFTGEEGDVWETKVLVRREHSTGKQVGLAHVIEEAADVTIETGIDAVQVLRLWGGNKWKLELENTCWYTESECVTHTSPCHPDWTSRHHFASSPLPPQRWSHLRTCWGEEMSAAANIRFNSAALSWELFLQFNLEKLQVWDTELERFHIPAGKPVMNFHIFSNIQPKSFFLI